MQQSNCVRSKQNIRFKLLVKGHHKFLFKSSLFRTLVIVGLPYKESYLGFIPHSCFYSPFKGNVEIFKRFKSYPLISITIIKRKKIDYYFENIQNIKHWQS